MAKEVEYWMGSRSPVPAELHVAVNSDRQTQKLNRQSAQDEDRSLGRGRKEQDGGNAEEETRRHDQQSCIFHGPFPYPPVPFNPLRAPLKTPRFQFLLHQHSCSTLLGINQSNAKYKGLRLFGEPQEFATGPLVL